MGKILVIKGANFSAVAVGKVVPVEPVEPVKAPVISISNLGVVTISAEGASSIYYTTNGSTPTISSDKYTTAFNVSSGTTVKAIAESASGAISAVSSKTYVSSGEIDIQSLTESNMFFMKTNSGLTRTYLLLDMLDVNDWSIEVEVRQDSTIKCGIQLHATSGSHWSEVASKDKENPSSATQVGMAKYDSKWINPGKSASFTNETDVDKVCHGIAVALTYSSENTGTPTLDEIKNNIVLTTRHLALCPI